MNDKEIVAIFDRWRKYPLSTHLIPERDELERVARLGAAVEAMLRAAAEKDGYHQANLTVRCFATGNHECTDNDWGWYVWTVDTQDEPLREDSISKTPQEAIDKAGNKV